MRPILRRIAIHGGLTAIVLGIIGMMFAELATIWMSVSLAQRSTSSANGTNPDTSAMRKRLPLFMAGSGFAVVAIGEVMVHFWRRNRLPAAVPTQQPPDATEKLLEELLAQAEAKATKPQGTVAPTTPLAENTPAPTPPNHLTDGES